MTREARVTQHAPELYGVDVRERPFWLPVWWFSPWMRAVEAPCETVAWSLDKAKALRELAEANGVIPQYYRKCRVIIE